MVEEAARNTVRLGLVTVANPLEVGAGQSPVLFDQLHTAFSTAGFKQLETLRAPQPVGDPQSACQAGRYFYEQRADAICVLSASWFEDYLVLDMLEECDVPLILWSRPGMETGSLCGMQQLGYILKQLGKPYCFVFDEVGARVCLS